MRSFISASLIAAIFLISGTHGYCQQNYATNVKTEISEDKMLITYDAPTRDGTPFYSIILMITYNGKAIQASSMYGDYGSKVEPGTEKAITWYYTNDFKEDIKRVSVSVFAYKVSEPKVYFDVASKGNNGFAPCEIKVSNSSSNVNEYNWDFGDPESGINNHSTEKEPVHVYEHAGIFNITLTGRNSLLGLQGTSYNTVEIKEHEPTVADFSFIITGNKPPYEVKFTNSSKNGDILAWNFGDPGAGAKNNTSDKPNPVYKYKQAGTYMVELTAKSSVSGLSDKVTKEVTMRAPLNPVAGFILSLSQESAPAIAQFKNTSTNSGSFKWNFGDPGSGNQNSSTDTDPAHTYLKAGKFEVVLIASNPQTGKTDKHSEFVTIQGPPKSPVAGFKIGNNNVFGPVTINFTNTSTDADYYTWDFGDPGSGSKNTSNESSPIHTYTNAGRYTVALKAGSSKTNETNSYTDYVNIIEAAKPPVARFTIVNNNPVSPATVSFSNSSSNALSYSWDFGDSSSGAGNNSRETNPSHYYSKSGTYKVTLTAKSASGDGKTYSDNVIVTEPATPPVARFTIVNNNAVSQATVSFSNSSSNAVSYSWDFGDSSSGKGNKSGETNPSHYYSKPGTYKVSLTAKSASGDGKTYSDNVIIAEPAIPPVARFTIDNNNTTSPATVSFSNSSSNAISYSWNFGDPASGANTSTEINPSHRYFKAGKYPVILTAKNSSGAVSTWSDNVVIIEPEKPPVASFTIDNNNATSPATVRFTNSSSNAFSYSWNFGDSSSGAGNKSTEANTSHKYANPGTYPVTLTVKSASGDVRTCTDNVILTEPAKPPVARFTIDNNNVTSPAAVRFTNNSSNAVSYSWDFGDPSSGDNTSAEINPSHNYGRAGKYPVSLTAKNSSGNVSTWSENVFVVEPEILPLPKFNVENNNANSPVSVRFTNTSSNAVSYSWDFGDPSAGTVNQSSDTNPVHTYDKPGRYQVALTAKNSSGTPRVFTDFVTVNEPPKPPVAKFSIENNNVIGPATVSFSNTSENANVYKWDFGDPESGIKNTSDEANPVHTYLKPGNFKVRLTASEKQTGNANETEMTVTIMEPLLPPMADFTYVLSGKYAPLDVSFTNKSGNADSYKWLFGDSQSGENESSGTNPVHRYEKPGSYTITLEAGSSRSGKTHVAIKEITISEKYNTYLKTFGKKNSDEIATCILSPESGQYIALINENMTGATIVTFDREGNRFTEKKLNNSIYDIIVRPDKKGYILAGIDYPNDLIVQLADNQFNLGNPAIVYSNVFDPGYRFTSLHTALSSKNEVGIVGNLVNDANQSNIWFQKTDVEGKPVVARGKTFRFIGYKTANQIIPTGDGEFAVTGSYQQDMNSPREMMLGMVNSDGTGIIYSMSSKQNLTGCDIIEVVGGNFEILAARESPNNPDFSELSLKLVDRVIKPMNCNIDLVYLTRTSDFRLFPPRMIATSEGYILLTHVFNGTDIDIALLWIDKGGSLLLRKEEIKRPGDQFGTGLILESDGSLVITGAERTQGDLDAIIIKTDPQGKYSDSGDGSGN